MSVIDRYLVLLADTVTVSSLARNQRRDAEVAEGAKERDDFHARITKNSQMDGGAPAIHSVIRRQLASTGVNR